LPKLGKLSSTQGQEPGKLYKVEPSSTLRNKLISRAKVPLKQEPTKVETKAQMSSPSKDCRVSGRGIGHGELARGYRPWGTGDKLARQSGYSHYGPHLSLTSTKGRLYILLRSHTPRGCNAGCRTGNGKWMEIGSDGSKMWPRSHALPPTVTSHYARLPIQRQTFRLYLGCECRSRN
jgi:hypothetical protein